MGIFVRGVIWMWNYAIWPLEKHIKILSAFREGRSLFCNQSNLQLYSITSKGFRVQDGVFHAQLGWASDWHALHGHNSYHLSLKWTLPVDEISRHFSNQRVDYFELFLLVTTLPWSLHYFRVQLSEQLRPMIFAFHFHQYHLVFDPPLAQLAPLLRFNVHHMRRLVGFEICWWGIAVWHPATVLGLWYVWASAEWEQTVTK